MQIWSSPAPERQLPNPAGPGGNAGGGEENGGCSLQKCSLEIYFPEVSRLPELVLPTVRLRPAGQPCPSLLQGSVTALWG